MTDLSTRIKALELEAELQRILLANKLQQARLRPNRQWLLPAIGAVVSLATRRKGFWRIAAAFIASRYLAKHRRRSGGRS